MIYFKNDFKDDDEYLILVASSKYIPNIYLMDNNVCYKDKNVYFVIRKENYRIEKNGQIITVSQLLKEKDKDLIKYIKLQFKPT